MKRKIGLILILTLSFGVVLLGASSIFAAAQLGSGAEVMANGIDMVKTGLLGKKLCFTEGDFKMALGTSNFDSVTVLRIPSSTEGALMCNGRRVGEGKVIKRQMLSSLVFIPSSPSVMDSSFTFKVNGAGAGEATDCKIRFIDKVNYAPKTEVGDVSAAAKTGEGIPVYGKMWGEDPEGDTLTYMVISYPKNGYLDYVDQATGKYCYAPSSGFVGSDKFTYVVRDEYGNYSYPETVSITVNRRMCDTVYLDMTQREEYNAAIAMTAMGVMEGKLVGDGRYFMPDETLTREEFVAMAMKSAGIRADSTLTKTCFDDDANIEAGLKSYIATAQRIGLVNGDFKDGMLTFSPKESITKYEAAQIMAALLGIDSEGEEVIYSGDELIPVWARSGVCAMMTLNIFDADDSKSLTDAVTRGQGASYLYRMIDSVSK